MSKMQLLAGTSGYAYDQWRDSFYPTGLKKADRLRHYGSKLSTVEINSTFYRLPRASTLRDWTEQVPEDFRFTLKASRRITHFARLNGAPELAEYLFEASSALGKQLGPILFQLPPDLKCDVSLLRDFIQRLPAKKAVVFEFRHTSWFNEPVYDALRQANIALCFSDQKLRGGETPLVATADWTYARLRKSSYSDDELSALFDKLSGLGCGQAFVYFKHEEGTDAPDLAARLLAHVNVQHQKLQHSAA